MGDMIGVPILPPYYSLRLLPFIVPTALSAIAFWWLYDAQFSVISWTLTKAGLIDGYIDLKMQEVTKFRMTTHPVEYEMYYSV